MESGQGQEWGMGRERKIFLYMKEELKLHPCLGLPLIWDGTHRTRNLQLCFYSILSGQQRMSMLASEKEGLDHELQNSGQPSILPTGCRNGENGQPSSIPHLLPSLSLCVSNSKVHTHQQRLFGNADSEGPGKGLRLCISYKLPGTDAAR